MFGDARGFFYESWNQCRYREARIERSDLFRKRLTREGAAEKPEREDDVDYWLRQFGE